MGALFVLILCLLHVLYDRPDHHPCLMKPYQSSHGHSSASRPFRTPFIDTVPAYEMSQENKPAYQERYGDDLSKDDEIIGSNFHRDYFPGNISSAFASRIAHRATKRS